MSPGAGELPRQLDGVADGQTGVLEELREIARGLHPAALAEGGLRPAMKTLARRSAVPVPVRLDIGVDGRLPEPIELAAYYVVTEVLTNTAKHAAATVIDDQMAADADAGVLGVRIRDDGRGGADPHPRHRPRRPHRPRRGSRRPPLAAQPARRGHHHADRTTPHGSERARLTRRSHRPTGRHRP